MRKKFSILFAAVMLAVCIFSCGLFAACDDGEKEYDTYPPVQKAAVQAKTLNVIDKSDVTPAEMLTLITLQGITANLTDDQIFLTSSEAPMNDTSLQYLQDEFGVKVTVYEDVWDIFAKYKGLITGYILCNVGEPSVNVATGFAGAKKAVAVDESLEQRMKDELELTLVKDVRQWDETILSEAYMRQEGFSDTYAFELSYTDIGYLRDYAAMVGGLVFWVGVEDKREAVMDNLNLRPEGFVMGYGDYSITGNENVFIQGTSEHGINYLPCNWSINLSVLSGFPTRVETVQKSPDTVESYDAGKHYVTFLLSDGDNIQWATNNGNDAQWWGSDARGEVPVAWTVAPTMNELAPAVQDFRYSTQSEADNFIVHDSSFMFFNYYPEEYLPMHCARLNEYMGLLDVSSCSILGMRSFMGSTDNVWNYYMSQPNLNGILYFEWGGGGYSAWDGMIRWVNDKPIISCAAEINTAETDLETFVEKVNTRALAEGGTDPTKAACYTLVYVNCWGVTVQDMKDAMDQFSDNVEVVNADQLIDLVTHHQTAKPAAA